MPNKNFSHFLILSIESSFKGQCFRILIFWISESNQMCKGRLKITIFGAMKKTTEYSLIFFLFQSTILSVNNRK